MTVLRPNKRHLLLCGGAVAAAMAAPAVFTGEAFAEEKGVGKKLKKMVTGEKEKEEEVTPPEDLMREHGVLDRVLLLYEAGIRKWSSNEDFDSGLIVQSAEVPAISSTITMRSPRKITCFRALRKPGRWSISSTPCCGSTRPGGR